MNTANLQLEGAYAVLAALLHALRDKEVLSDAEIDHLLMDVVRGKKFRPKPSNCRCRRRSPETRHLF
jgi:hypothetical protein